MEIVTKHLFHKLLADLECCIWYAAKLDGAETYKKAL